MAVFGELLIQGGAFGFPSDHLIAYLFDDFGRVAHYEAAGRNLHIGFHKAKGTDDAFVPDMRMVHDDGVHTYQYIFSYLCAMHDGTMPDVRTLL